MPEETAVSEPKTPAFSDFVASVRTGVKEGGSVYSAAAAAYKPEAATEVVDKKEDKANVDADDKPGDKPADAAVAGEKEDTPAAKDKPSRLERKVARVTREYKDQIAALTAKVEALSKPVDRVETSDTPAEDAEPVEPEEGDFSTVAEYVKALRGFDKEHAAWKAKQDAVASRAFESDAVYRSSVQTFLADRDRIMKDEKYKDYMDVANSYKGPDMSPVLERVTVMAGDATLMYDYCTTKGMVRKLNGITEDAGVAILKSADAPAAVLRYLAANPDEVTKINELPLAKRAAFVGKIEARVESEAKAGSDTYQRKDETRNSGGNVAGEKPKGEHTDTAGKGEKAPKTKADVDPKVTGGSAAPQTNWAASVDMSFAERARLMKEAQVAKRR